VIAHNAAFDRPFLERRFPAFASRPWGCSMADVPWMAEGLPTTKLEWLAERHAGVFYDAHRADVDTIAGVHLLASTLPSGRRAMDTLLERVRQRTLRVWALGAPFATKAILKARGYRWSGGEDGLPKAWWRDVGEADLAVEGEWLAADVYGGGLCRAQVQRFGPKVRYSARIGTLQMDDLLAHARM
jgi:DNA polymerase-3 subunit epsilon